MLAGLLSLGAMVQKLEMLFIQLGYNISDARKGIYRIGFFKSNPFKIYEFLYCKR